MRLGLAIVILFSLSAVFAPLLTKENPNKFSLSQSLSHPSHEHFLGTDENGADVFARLLYGARLSLKVALSVVGISTLLGLIIGSLAGYFGGPLEEVVMRLIDILQAFPGFLLALAIIAFMGSSVDNLILALCITGWVASAKLVRAEIKSLVKKDFVSAAHAIGVPHSKIIVQHLWPNVLPLLTVQMSFAIAATIVSEAGLTFLGLGAPPNVPSWGSLLASGRHYLLRAPYLSIFSGLAIILIVLGFNLLGDGLRRHLNPHTWP